MTINVAYQGVDVLLPAHVHRARERAAKALLTDLLAFLDTLETSAGPQIGDDPDTFKSWASYVIQSLPTRSFGDDNHGHR